MFAVIKTGGKQYKVAKDDTIVIEKLEGDAGSKVTFDDVLMVGEGKDVTIGAPTVSGASVTGEIAEYDEFNPRVEIFYDENIPADWLQVISDGDEFILNFNEEEGVAHPGGQTGGTRPREK